MPKIAFISILCILCGFSTGFIFGRKSDPLHNESPLMTKWLVLNTSQDFGGMYDISSDWLKKDMTKEDFIQSYGYKKSDTYTPPDIIFIASIDMPADGVSEDFYLIEKKGDRNLTHGMMYRVYVDADGKFMGYPQG